MTENEWDLIVVGGGLAGLTAALHLSQNSCKVALLEKNPYPHHKVCGEYVSNEVLEYLNSLGINPIAAGAKVISKFHFSNINGECISAELPFGGFCISRYAFDELLYNQLNENVTVIFDTVQSIIFENNYFKVETLSKRKLQSKFILGAFGKRSNIDLQLKRKFMQQQSPWLAVKAHFEYDFPDDTVALHNFNGGYCGLSKTESSLINACYLTTLKSFKKYNSIESFQENVLSENPFLKDFFQNAKPVFKHPLTISQISFQPKQPVENNIFMAGDSAGFIHPLCGNGMAMAIHSARIFSELFLRLGKQGGNKFDLQKINRKELEEMYIFQWKKAFTNRLQTGRILQSILQNKIATQIGFSIIKKVPRLLPAIIKRTHGASNS